jgi:hypothetical protein
MRRLLEPLYFDSGNEQSTEEYAKLSESVGLACQPPVFHHVN